MPGGGHTAVLGMVSSVPELPAAASRGGQEGHSSPLCLVQPAHGGPSVAHRLPQSRRGFPPPRFLKRCGWQKHAWLEPVRPGTGFQL